MQAKAACLGIGHPRKSHKAGYFAVFTRKMHLFSCLKQKAVGCFLFCRACFNSGCRHALSLKLLFLSHKMDER